MELNDYIKNWSEKLSISEQDIEKEYQGVIIEERKIHPNLSDGDVKIRALQRLAMDYKTQLRSPAVGFEGMIIAVGDLIDTVQNQKRLAYQLFKDNPQMAIVQGVTNEEGVPLDTRQQWSDGRPNKSYGHPLPEHNYLRTIFGVCSRKNNGEPRFFILSLSGVVANQEIPVFEPTQFRAIDRTPPELDTNQYRLNSSVFTKFIVDREMNIPETKTLIDKFCEKLSIKDLVEYHTSNETNYNRLAVIEGDVTQLVMEPTSVGSRRMVIDDEQGKFDLEAKGLTCWVPERINIDFAEQSKVIVLGRTSRGKKLDENGNPTEEPGDVMLNVYGLYAIPEYKIQPQMKDLPEVVSVERQAEDEITSDW